MSNTHHLSSSKVEFSGTVTPNLPTEDELDKSIKYFGVARGLTWEQAEQLVVDLQPAINHYVTKRELEARIDEQENEVMLDGSNGGCQGCYNAIMRNSDRIAELEAQKEQENK